MQLSDKNDIEGLRDAIRVLTPNFQTWIGAALDELVSLRAQADARPVGHFFKASRVHPWVQVEKECPNAVPLYTHPEASAGLRVFFNKEELDALYEAIEWAKDEGLPGTAEHLQAIFDAHNPEASAPGLSEREIADTVNKVRDIALQFHATQQLRERIARVLVPILTRASAATVAEPRTFMEKWAAAIKSLPIGDQQDAPSFADELRQMAFAELFEFQELTGCNSPAEYREKLAAQQQAEPVAEIRHRNGHPYAAMRKAYDANGNTLAEGTLLYAGSQQAEPWEDERAAFEAWCERFPEISSVERLQEAYRAAQSGQRAGVAEGFTDSDVYTLIGHAEYLKGIGQTDMPVWMYGMAERVATAIADPGLADRCRQLAAPTQQQEGGNA